MAKESIFAGIVNSVASLIHCTFRGQQTDVQSALSELEDSEAYSTDEEVCGVWEDGKTLYRRIVHLSLPTPNGTNTDIGELPNASNIDHVFAESAYFILKGSGERRGTIFNVPAISGSTYYGGFFITDANHVLYSNSMANVPAGTPFTIIIKYTKLSD